LAGTKYPNGTILDEDRTRDRRLINFFNIVFHGSTYTGEANDFLKNNPRHASFALFPYGFFVDPILGKYDDSTNGEFRPIIINGKYYLTDVVPTLPKVFFKIKKKNIT